MGADDYITKPFFPREVAARVKTVLRRAEQPEARSELLQIGNIRLDLDGRAATVSGDPIELTRTEFDLLAILMRYPGRAYTRAHLLEQLLDIPYYEGDERTVDQHVKNLRQKIEPDPSQPRYILTVRGIGYKLAEE
jgi:two-component system alkaline phosphatase synthesis response regulator PhoP